MALTDQQYADNERKRHEILIRRTENVTLREKSDARASYSNYLWEEPIGKVWAKRSLLDARTDWLVKEGRLAERTGWILEGSYGVEPCRIARETAASNRKNRAAVIGQLIAALDHNCTAANARKAWKGLPPDQQSIVNGSIESALDEWLADPENQG